MTKNEKESIIANALEWSNIAYYYSCSVFDGKNNLLVTDYSPHTVVLNASKFLKYRNSNEDIIIYGAYNKTYDEIYELAHDGEPVPTHPLFKEITLSGNLKKVRKIVYYFEDIKLEVKYNGYKMTYSKSENPKPDEKIKDVKKNVKFLSYVPKLDDYCHCLYITENGKIYYSIEEAIYYTEATDPNNDYIEVTIVNLSADGQYGIGGPKSLFHYLRFISNRVKVRSVILDKNKTEVISEFYYEEKPTSRGYKNIWYQIDYDLIYEYRSGSSHDNPDPKDKMNDYGFTVWSDTDISIIPRWIGHDRYFSPSDYAKQAVLNYQICTSDEFICKMIDLDDFVNNNLIDKIKKLYDDDLGKVYNKYYPLKRNNWRCIQDTETDKKYYCQEITICCNNKFIPLIAIKNQFFEKSPRYSFMYPIKFEYDGYLDKILIYIDADQFDFSYDYDLILLTE